MICGYSFCLKLIPYCVLLQPTRLLIIWTHTDHTEPGRIAVKGLHGRARRWRINDLLLSHRLPCTSILVTTTNLSNKTLVFGGCREGACCLEGCGSGGVIVIEGNLIGFLLSSNNSAFISNVLLSGWSSALIIVNNASNKICHCHHCNYWSIFNPWYRIHHNQFLTIA